MGIDDEEYIHWIDAGWWNLDGDGGVLARVTQYRSLAGSDAWKLVAANVSYDAAYEQSLAEGVPAIVEAAEVMLGLRAWKGLGGDVEPEPASAPQPKSPRSPERIDFS